ncbi:MAG: GNAT family N-acetyltransferase [Micrococcales bacterium]|nr:GNAT family N-acetyltransferase [Micrococcales bacterium]
MTARRPPAAPLEGRFLRLETFDAASHTAGLQDALAHADVFAGGYGGGPEGLPRTAEEFARWVAGYGTGSDAIKFVARIVGGEFDGRIVGASTLGDLDEEQEKAHIGWTAWDPRVWGTQVNPEAKLLMLGLAFDHGFGRVKLQADSRNERSRTAILRLGASFEGILRRDRIRADGTFSGTAVYSILTEEWPAVREGLERRLAIYPRPVRLHG